MRVLVAPLDWGLGHATRCVPVVRSLRARGVDVILGCSGRAGSLLQDEFPHLPYIDLPAYGIRYAHRSMVVSMARQLPRLLLRMRHEHLLLGELVRRHHLRAVISDNRYGLYHPKVHSVLITHQLHPEIPGRLLDRLVQPVLGRWIRRFGACWVPDLEGAGGLAGRLAHPPRHPATEYIGPLSRFRPLPPETPWRYDLLCLCSGPEPQRTLLEESLMPQLRASGKRVLMLLGKPEADDFTQDGRMEVRAHLPAAELNEAMANSRTILSRPGYSTIMDLRRIGRPAIFIPTPGQTEQEFLADRLHQLGYFYRHPQAGFDVQEALLQAAAYTGFPEPPSGVEPRLEAVIDRWLARIAEPIN